MKLLVTAGNTQTPIDRVRCITNIFTGRTGANIAKEAHARGHDVTLLTSHPDVSMPFAVWEYQTFNDLETLMSREIRSGHSDAIVHCAAVNDYHVVGTFARRGAEFIDVGVGKLKSTHEELWIRMTPAPKLVDRIRRDWGFQGVLVKFKLEVGVTDDELLTVAERSRQHSQADLMVANTLEAKQEWAYIGDGAYSQVERNELYQRLMVAIEKRMDSRVHEIAHAL